jgi:hypothetical protein
MKKSELIEMLSDPDLPDIEVFMSKDGEGNAFRLVEEVSYHDDEDEFIYEETGGPALILWPVY